MTRILCIEDEAAIRESIVEELEDAEYEVFEAENGREGIQAVLKHKPELILCDITMPEMNGYEVLETLRTNHPEHGEIPFVFLSALADREDVITGRNKGADDYLTKPIDFELLLSTVESRLRQVKRMRQSRASRLTSVLEAAREELEETASPSRSDISSGD